MVPTTPRGSASRSCSAEVWEKGGAGGEALGARGAGAPRRPDRALRADLRRDAADASEKIETIVSAIYGGDGVDYSPAADRAIDHLESIGLRHTPVCMAKTQYSLTDDPSRLGKPTRIPHHGQRSVRRRPARVSSSRRRGDIMTMPGLPKVPAAERMAVMPNGEIVGLS